MEELIANDMIEDLAPVIKKYMAPKVFEKLNALDGALFEEATRGEKIYGIPATSNVEGSLRTLWIRKDWLEAVGAEVPTTMEQVLDLAEKFTTEDPDGNGENDTYGLPMDKSPATSLVNTYEIIANAYGMHPFRTKLGEDGKYQQGSYNPELKTVLQKLHDLYAAGGFDPEFAVKDFAQVDDSVAAGKIGMWMGVFWKPVDPGFATTYADGVEWIAAAIPASETVDAYKPYVTLPYNEYYVIRKGYEHPEAICMVANHMLTSEPTKDAYVAYSLGINKSDPKYLTFNYNNFATLSFQNPLFFDASPLEKALAMEDFDIDKPAFEVHATAYNILKGLSEADDVTLRQYQDIFLKSCKIHEEYPKENYVFEAYRGAQTETTKSMGSILKTMEEETIARIISGIDTVDAYDKFIEDARSQGGDQILEEMNAKLK